MAPRKATKIVGGKRRANVELDYDPSKFLSKVAQEEYEKLRGRSIAKERGFVPRYIDGQLEVMIYNRGWYWFCEQPVEVPTGIVREFYANGKVGAIGYSFVRGTTVEYQPEVIRALFQIPPPPDGAQDWCLRSHEDLDLNMIVARLCVPGTDWKRKEGTGEPMTFLAKQLNRYAQAWNLFICANLMPSRHVYEINVPRAILLWGILHDEYIDLGYLLYSSMIRYMQSNTNALIPHAAVVAQLCSRAGIEWGIEEQMQRPMGPINHTTISQLEEWPGGIAHGRGLGYIIQDPQADAGGGQDAEEDTEDERTEEAVPSPRQQRATRGTRVSGAGPSRVRAVMTDQQHRRLRRQVDAVNDRTARFATDMIASLDEMSRALGYAGNWPTYGEHHPYPAPDSPPEEGGADE